jgi:DNA-binding CsgD family transcriptional regulator
MAVGMNAAQAEAWRLTARQREVLWLVAQARSDKEIAAALGLSENTVGQHLDRIFKKLGIHSRIAAVLQLGAHIEAGPHGRAGAPPLKHLDASRQGFGLA